MALSTQKDLSSRLALAGGAKALVEKVIGVLEDGLSAYKIDKDSFDTSVLESLQPDLSLLINITEEMKASMQSRSELYEKARQRAYRAIGRCNDHARELQAKQDIFQARIAGGQAAAAEDLKELRALKDSIAENDRKIAEVKGNLNQLATFWWVPGYNWYLAGKAIDDAVYKRQSLLAERLREAENHRKSTEERMRDQEDLVTELTKEKRAMQNKIEALQQSKTKFEESSKLYAAKVATLSNAVVFYGQLSTAIEVMEDNLDLPNTIQRLYESSDLVLITGEVRRDSLKEILIHLGGDYDGFLEDEGLVKPVNISFKLFNMHDTLDSAYRLATVQEVTDHRDSLFKAMPSWEIANLADGSVDGRLYGGCVRRQIRDDVAHKLGIWEDDGLLEEESTWEDEGMQEPVSISFKLFNIHDRLDPKYRLATVQEVTDHRDALFEAMPSWEIANLADGSVDGHSYGGSVRRQIRDDVAQKLGILEDKSLLKPVSISFKLFNIHNPMDPKYRLATMQEVTNHRDALFEAMPSWEIANLADGSVDGRSYGGSVRQQIRDDVNHKLGILNY